MTAEDELLDMDAWTVPDGWIPHRVAPCMGPGCGRMLVVAMLGEQ